MRSPNFWTSTTLLLSHTRNSTARTKRQEGISRLIRRATLRERRKYPGSLASPPRFLSGGAPRGKSPDVPPAPEQHRQRRQIPARMPDSRALVSTGRHCASTSCSAVCNRDRADGPRGLVRVDRTERMGGTWWCPGHPPTERNTSRLLTIPQPWKETSALRA
jgi:hypothetical protein